MYINKSFIIIFGLECNFKSTKSESSAVTTGIVLLYLSRHYIQHISLSLSVCL
jgi:hypothetical protein